jgi:hypothetical protein
MAAWQESVGGGLVEVKEGTHTGQWRLGSVGNLDGGLAGTRWRRARRSQGGTHGWRPGASLVSSLKTR